MARKLAVELYWMWRRGLGLRTDAAARFARASARVTRHDLGTHEGPGITRKIGGLSQAEAK